MKKIMKYLKAVSLSDGGGPSLSSVSASDICYADIAKLETFSSELLSLKSEIEASISAMFETINGMDKNNVWSGSVYDQFKAKCNSFRGALDSYAAVVGVFSDQVKVIEDAATQFIELVDSLCNGG